MKVDNVIILANFCFPPRPSYSVWYVIKEQANILSQLGFSVQTILETKQGFKVEQQQCHTELDLILVDESQDKKQYYNMIQSYLTENTVIVTHDFLLTDLCMQLMQNMSGEKPVKWLHFHHANPEFPKPLSIDDLSLLSFYPLPDACYVTQLEQLQDPMCETMQVASDRVFSISNSIDVNEYYNLNATEQYLVEQANWWQADVRCIYPAVRSINKNWSGLLLLLGHLAKQGLQVSLIAIDTSYTDEISDDEFSLLLQQANQKNFTVVSSSDLGFKWGIERESVHRLFQVSNVFVLSSMFETASLILQEAAMGKNIIVSNEDFQPVKELVDDHALSFSFDKLQSDECYLQQAADKISDELQFNKSIKVQNKILKKNSLDNRKELYWDIFSKVDSMKKTLLDLLLGHDVYAKPTRFLINSFRDVDFGVAHQLSLEYADLQMDLLDCLLAEVISLEKNMRLSGLSFWFSVICDFEKIIRNIQVKSYMSDLMLDNDKENINKIHCIPYGSVIEHYLEVGCLAGSLEELRGLLAESYQDKIFLIKVNEPMNYSTMLSSSNNLQDDYGKLIAE